MTEPSACPLGFAVTMAWMLLVFVGLWLHDRRKDNAEKDDED